MGAGGIGGIVAATLTEVGAAVTAVSTNPAIRAAVDAAGYRVIDDGEERVVRGWVAPVPEGSYDLCVLATQPPSVEDAARTALHHLADDGLLLAGVVEEDAVTGRHLPQVLAGQGVGHPVPEGGAVAGQVVEAVATRFLLAEPEGHWPSPVR